MDTLQLFSTTDNIKELIQQVHELGRHSEFEFAQKINTELKNRSLRLAKKVAGQVDLASDEKSTLIQKLAPEIEKIFEFIPYSVQDIFERDLITKKLFDFMEECEKGIIQFQTLIQRKTDCIGNIVKEDASDYYEIYSMIEQKLLSAVPTTGGAGSWGPGELGLSIIGSPVKKSKTKGDLIVDGKLVELKASKNPARGGRINTDAISSGANGRKEYEDALKKLIKEANLRKSTGEFYKFTELGTSKNGTSIKIYNFGPKLISFINEKILEAKPDPQIVQNFLKKVVLSSVIKDQRSKANIDWINDAVNPDTAEIIPNKVVYGYIFMLASFYKELENIDIIFILNPNDGSYHISNSPSDLVKSIDNEILSIGSTYIDFTQNQGKASPQLGIVTQKERRRREELKKKESSNGNRLN